MHQFSLHIFSFIMIGLKVLFRKKKYFVFFRCSLVSINTTSSFFESCIYCTLIMIRGVTRRAMIICKYTTKSYIHSSLYEYMIDKICSHGVYLLPKTRINMCYKIRISKFLFSFSLLFVTRDVVVIGEWNFM